MMAVSNTYETRFSEQSRQTLLSTKPSCSLNQIMGRKKLGFVY